MRLPRIQLKPVLLAALLVLPWPALAAPAGWSVLLEAVELAALLQDDSDIRVLRVSGDHAAGHIPGSLPVSYADFRGPSENPGVLPAIEDLTATLQALGLNADTPVVLVHQGSDPGDMGTSTRIYWTLKSLGLEHLSILNGGFLAWQAADLPVSNNTTPVPASDYTPRWRDDWQIGADEIVARIDDSDLRLIDARPPAFFNGSESSIARPGTIAGAQSLPFAQWFQGGHLRDADSIRAQFAASALSPAAQTVSFCNSGHWASINWFVMHEIVGVPQTRMYAESMAEWSQARRPMENEPDRLGYYWQMTKDWYIGLTE
jgi:thiosulfate/3-mercaptopyruvate sulfurtransferase